MKKLAEFMSQLRIAIPSKGRLKDNAGAWLEGCGFTLRQQGGERGYRAAIEGLNADVMFLSAQEIANSLINGTIHFGITGQDLLHESSYAVTDRFSGFTHNNTYQPVVVVLKPLEFGNSKVVLAVPRAWIDVTSMSDFEEVTAQYLTNNGRRLRVATKYNALTRTFFEAHGIVAYRIVDSVGATEAAPASGTADAIVDITSTGATLEANGLKLIRDGLILSSQAVLAKSLSTNWSKEAKLSAETFLDAVT